jgi:hypothetical protein
MTRLARICYDAYKRERQAAVPTIPFTPFDELPAVQLHAWETAAETVAAEVRREIRDEQQEAQKKASGGWGNFK